MEAHAAVSFSQSEVPELRLFSSQELDVVSVDAGDEDSSSHSPAYEELLEVVTSAVEKLKIEWPAERQEVHQKSTLSERFLPSRSQPLCWGFPFFRGSHLCNIMVSVPNLHLWG